MTYQIRNCTAAMVLFLVLALKAEGQDIIYLITGEEIQSKITEISEAEIRYKKFVHVDGTNYVLSSKEVFMILYEDGTKKIITPVNKSASTPQVNNSKEVDDKEYELGDTVIYFNYSSFLDARIIGFHTEQPLAQIELLKNGQRLLVNNNEIFKSCGDCQRTISIIDSYCCNGQLIKVGDKVVVSVKNDLKTGTVTFIHPHLDFAEVILTKNIKPTVLPFKNIIVLNGPYLLGFSVKPDDNVIYYDGVFKSGTVKNTTELDINIVRYYRENGIECIEKKRIAPENVLKLLSKE